MAPNRRNSIPCTVRTSRRAIKGLVVFNSWDLEPLDQLNDLALGCYEPSSPEVLLEGYLLCLVFYALGEGISKNLTIYTILKKSYCIFQNSMIMFMIGLF